MSIRLVEDQNSPLRLEVANDCLRLILNTRGLLRQKVESWLRTHGIACFDCNHSTAPKNKVLNRRTLPTLVLAVDPNVDDIAHVYANAVNAPLSKARDPASIEEAILDLEDGQSLTVVMLSTSFDEWYCQTIHAANQKRKDNGLAPVCYGFLAALTPAHLAWLVVKTLALMFAAPLPKMTFASWDFVHEEHLARKREAETGRTVQYVIENPWLDEEVGVLSVRAHGASFDLSLGDTVLCCHQEPPLPKEYRKRGPSCFHDGNCFRMTANGSPPVSRILAQDATPLVWCLDSCATIPFAGNAFGTMAYTSGLVAGTAVGVIGPFLDIITSGGLSRIYEGVIATGGSLGEAALAACSHEPAKGCDRFLLIGSPDLRLLPRAHVEPDFENDRITYRMTGDDQMVWRLKQPQRNKDGICVVEDDGADHWSQAFCDLLKDEAGSYLLVTLPQPSGVDGWLRVVPGSPNLKRLIAETTRISEALGILQSYEFIEPAKRKIADCENWIKCIRRIARYEERLRSRSELADALANLYLSVEILHQHIAELFLAEPNISLDRMPGIGFDLETTERSSDTCPTCQSELYVTMGHWVDNSSYARRWIQCPNCAGIALSFDCAPLEVLSLTAQIQDAQLLVTLFLHNRMDVALRSTLAGQARNGPPESKWGPGQIILEPNETRRFCFAVPELGEAGVISYRVLTVCSGLVQIYALKQIVEAPVPKTDVADHKQGSLLQ